MSRKTLGALAAALLILTVGYLLPTGAGKAIVADDRAILPLSTPADATGLQLSDGPSVMSLRRAPEGGWSDADGTRSSERDRFIEGLLASLTVTPRGRRVIATNELETFGIGALSVRLAVAVAGRTGEIVLRFGDVTPLGDSVYARDENDPQNILFLAPRGVRDLLANAATGVRIDDAP